MKSASLSVETSKISFCPTKYFILSDKCLAEITKITMITIELSYKIGFCPTKNCSLPDSSPAAEKKRFHENEENPKFQASNCFLKIYSLVCVRPGRKPSQKAHIVNVVLKGVVILDNISLW